MGLKIEWNWIVNVVGVVQVGKVDLVVDEVDLGVGVEHVVD